MRHADLLAEVPMFEGLTDADREVLGTRLTERNVAAGKLVFAKGDWAHLALANAAYPLPPRRLAVAPVKKMLPLP